MVLPSWTWLSTPGRDGFRHLQDGQNFSGNIRVSFRSYGRSIIGAIPGTAPKEAGQAHYATEQVRQSNKAVRATQAFSTIIKHCGGYCLFIWNRMRIVNSLSVNHGVPDITGHRHRAIVPSRRRSLNAAPSKTIVAVEPAHSSGFKWSGTMTILSSRGLRNDHRIPILKTSSRSRMASQQLWHGVITSLAPVARI